jgi:transposase
VSTGHAIVRKNEADLTNSQNKWGGPRKLKITAEAHHAIEGWVDERPDLTLSCLCTRLADQFAITITWQSMAKFLNRIGFPSKLIRAIPIARNSPKVLQAQRQYAQRVVSEAPADRRHVVWVDECGFNLHIRRKYGRSRRGERANVIVASSRGQHLSICAAMSEEGFLYDRIRPGAYSAEHFCTFLEELFEHLCERGRGPCWIVLDNVRFHHCAIVSCCAERNGHTLVFLPPYGPMLNPIESLFGKWKTLIHTQGVALTRDVLIEHMAIAKANITVEDCLGWIRDVGRNIALSFDNHLFE